MNLRGLLPAGRSQADDERAPVLFAGLALHPAFCREPVHDAGQRGPLVGEGPVQVGDCCAAEFVEVTKDVGFRLREARLMALDEQADAVCRAVDAEDQFEAHQTKHNRFRRIGSSLFGPAARQID